MGRRIIDAHQHLHGENTADRLAETYHAAGVVKAVLLGYPPRRCGETSAEVLAAHKKYPDLFVPFVGIDLDEMGPEDVARARDEGHVGIKFIGPRKAYNDAGYFPIYEKACELGMPVLFHLGIITNSGPWTDCDSNLMRPVHLDHIARRLPELRIIGAHLGNPWYEEATMSCRWNPNLFFDLSGSTLKKKRPEFLADLLWWTPTTAYKSPDRTSAWEKICCGTDVAWHQVSDVLHDYEMMMEALKLSPDIREKIWYGTAARVLGIE